jgi:predicted Zn-dependent protease
MLVAAAGTLGWAATWGIGAWRDAAELDRAGREMTSGRYAPARARLERLAARRPGRDRVEYALGVCEAALGHTDAALAAWGRVPRDSAMAPRAALERGRLALEHGRLAVAEEGLARAAAQGGAIGHEADGLIGQLLLFTGRADALALWFERRWRSGADPAAMLRARWLLDAQPPPVGPVRDALERFGREAPDDDRVWLGRAALASRTGRVDEADAWLSRCEARRPDDPDVARARLEWALAARRPDAAERALARIPADRLAPAAVAAVDARLAALRGDDEAERAALGRRVELEPGDAASWGRLADLAARDGPSDRLARLRGRKAAIDRAQDEYRRLMGAVAAGDLSRTAELARTAEALGRRFEARGWWTLRARRAPKTPRPARRWIASATGPPGRHPGGAGPWPT